MKVLIAEDNPLYRQMLEQNVSKWGFTPFSCSNGEEALSLLEIQTSPILVILDWLMPGMDGIDVCYKVKHDEDLPFMYIIMLTGKDEKEDMLKGLDSGADDYLTKPVDLDILKHRLNAARRIAESISNSGIQAPSIDGYQIQHKLGKGSIATVCKAIHEVTGAVVALKIVQSKNVTEEFFLRFGREIEMMKKLDHPNIARIYRGKLLEQIGYYAVEYIEGQTLEKYVKRVEPSTNEILEIISQVCDGLDHAHNRGVVHRDLKPSNIMVSSDGHPKLVDFGLGKSLFHDTNFDESEADQSIEGKVIGTPMFMAPEQARGNNDDVDGRSDVYSIGIVAYLLIVRRHPHNLTNKKIRDTLIKIAEGHIIPPSQQIDDFDKDLEKIMMKALAKEPALRYQSAFEFAQALREYIQNSN